MVSDPVIFWDAFLIPMWIRQSGGKNILVFDSNTCRILEYISPYPLYHLWGQYTSPNVYGISSPACVLHSPAQLRCADREALAEGFKFLKKTVAVAKREHEATLMPKVTTPSIMEWESPGQCTSAYVSVSREKFPNHTSPPSHECERGSFITIRKYP